MRLYPPVCVVGKRSALTFLFACFFLRWPISFPFLLPRQLRCCYAFPVAYETDECTHSLTHCCTYTIHTPHIRAHYTISNAHSHNTTHDVLGGSVKGRELKPLYGHFRRVFYCFCIYCSRVSHTRRISLEEDTQIYAHFHTKRRARARTDTPQTLSWKDAQLPWLSPQMPKGV